jgi:hypothetical protein
MASFEAIIILRFKNRLLSNQMALNRLQIYLQSVLYLPFVIKAGEAIQVKQYLAHIIFFNKKD